MRRGAARWQSGPLARLRIVVMDLIDLHGALEVTALRAAGARIIGKTVTDKLTFSLGGASPPPPPRSTHAIEAR